MESSLMNDTALMIGVVVFVVLVVGFFLDFSAKPSNAKSRARKSVGSTSATDAPKRHDRPAPVPLSQPEPQLKSAEQESVEEGPVESTVLKLEIPPTEVLVEAPENVQAAEPEPEPEPIPRLWGSFWTLALNLLTLNQGRASQ